MELARAEENPTSDLKIEYLLADICKPAFLCEIEGRFNLACSVYQLNCASSKQMLQSLVQNAYEILLPGGRFIGINISPFITEQAHFDKT